MISFWGRTQTPSSEAVKVGPNTGAQQLTSRFSIGGITMTKLSGKKPQRPFISPCHQPSSSVSFTNRSESKQKFKQSPGVFGDGQRRPPDSRGRRKLSLDLKKNKAKQVVLISFLTTAKCAAGHSKPQRESSCNLGQKNFSPKWLDRFGRKSGMIILPPPGKNVSLQGFCAAVLQSATSWETCQQKGRKTKHNKQVYLFQYHDNFSFLQVQLVLGFAFVVKHDLAILGHCGDTSAESMSDTMAGAFWFFWFFFPQRLNFSTVRILSSLDVFFDLMWGLKWKKLNRRKPSTRRDFPLTWVIQQVTPSHSKSVRRRKQRHELLVSCQFCVIL